MEVVTNLLGPRLKRFGFLSLVLDLVLNQIINRVRDMIGLVSSKLLGASFMI